MEANTGSGGSAMTSDAGRQIDKVDAVVIFGATGDLAKLETFPALAYAKGSWGLKEADALLPDGVPWHDPA
jgi:glucose-6-phosphate 1-dehydrogenase